MDPDMHIPWGPEARSFWPGLAWPCGPTGCGARVEKVVRSSDLNYCF